MSLKKGVTYLVESSSDSSVLIGLDARLHDGLIDWFDTVRDRAFPVKSTKDLPDGVEVLTDTGVTYAFRKLTRELYDQKVADKVVGSRAFSSTQEIQEFYKKYPR